MFVGGSPGESGHRNQECWGQGGYETWDRGCFGERGGLGTGLGTEVLWQNQSWLAQRLVHRGDR